jgi:UDP-glucose 4-epimerase
MKRIIVTGASGMVGTALVDRLQKAGHKITAVSRSDGLFPPGVRHVKVGAVDANTGWTAAMSDQDVLVHLAAALPSSASNSETFERVNAAGTARIVEQASSCGIRMIVHLSSIAVVTGNQSRTVISDDTLPAPVNAYGRSKLAAEKSVSQFASGERVGISLRPPLVYGAQSAGNWGSLLRLAASGLPLPFGAVDNRRTMISTNALVDIICRVVETAEPELSGSYAVSDRESVSLALIMRYLREGMGKRPLLLPCPTPILETPLRLIGQGRIADSLFGNLEIDSSRFRQTFGWTPSETAFDAIRRSGREFAAIRR